MHVRDVILLDSSLLPGTQTALPGSGVLLMATESGSLHQLALSAMGMVAGSIGIAKRLAQYPAEAAGAPAQTAPMRNSFRMGPWIWGLLYFLLWACLAFYKDN